MATTPNRTIYNTIKAALAAADKKNKALAHHMGVHVTTVSDWCKNKNQPSIQDLYRISEFLKTDIHKLLVPTNWTGKPEDGTVYFVPPKSTSLSANKKQKRRSVAR
jgi:putative transcriptional regulator